MIGHATPWGTTGYTILEEGQLNPATLQLDVQHYLICKPNGEVLEGHWTLEQARQQIERLEQSHVAE